MIETVVLLVIGLFLFALLFLRATTQPASAAAQTEHTESQTALIALELRLPRLVSTDRIFAEGDWDFICRDAPSLRGILIQERKSVALLWLREARACMAQLFRFHRIMVRRTGSLDVALEFKIFVNYASFVVFAAIAHCLIYLFGPFRTRGIVRNILATVDGVSSALGRTLAAMEPKLRASVESEWALRFRPASY